MRYSKLIAIVLYLTVSAHAMSGYAEAAAGEGPKLLQYKSGSHLLGFAPERACVISGSSSVIEEFVGSHAVTPAADGPVPKTLKGAGGAAAHEVNGRGKYQISSWATSIWTYGRHSGYFILDTVTGIRFGFPFSSTHTPLPFSRFAFISRASVGLNRKAMFGILTTSFLIATTIETFAVIPGLSIRSGLSTLTITS